VQHQDEEGDEVASGVALGALEGRNKASKLSGFSRVCPDGFAEYSAVVLD
jgi:hypothetical protein